MKREPSQDLPAAVAGRPDGDFPPDAATRSRMPAIPRPPPVSSRPNGRPVMGPLTTRFSTSSAEPVTVSFYRRRLVLEGVRQAPL